MNRGDVWPSLEVGDWQPTRESLHLWTQIIGKIRLAQAPVLNHWWQVPLYVTSRGLGTSSVPHGTELFDLEFDFIHHLLHLRTSAGAAAAMPLGSYSVAAFLERVTSLMAALDVPVTVSRWPNEIAGAVPFADDTGSRDYDPDAAYLFWRQLVQAHRLIASFRARFCGKVSPVHFFWGSFDLACTRFSGRAAPQWQGEVPHCPPWIMQEAYSREVSSCGFWPGGGIEGAFYSYAYPAPPGFAEYQITPPGASYSHEFGQFLLPWEAARAARDPGAAVLDFLQSTYEAAATLGDWPRSELDVGPGRWRHLGERPSAAVGPREHDPS